jgi:hypothetical protein
MIKSHGFFGCSNGWLGFEGGDVVREARKITFAIQRTDIPALSA